MPAPTFACVSPVIVFPSDSEEKRPWGRIRGERRLPEKHLSAVGVKSSGSIPGRVASNKMELPTESCSSSLNIRALLDLHLQDRLPSEVREGLADMFVKFHQEVNASFVLGLEHLVINMSNLLPNTNNNSSDVGFTNKVGTGNDEIMMKLLSESASKRLGDSAQDFSEKGTSSVAAATENVCHLDLFHQGDSEHEEGDKLPTSSAARPCNAVLQQGQNVLISCSSEEEKEVV